MGGEVTPEMMAEAERLGAQVWTYSYRFLSEGYSPCDNVITRVSTPGR